ncbi:MAG TPA: hypothetical protein VGS03_10400 [Candidatus Polarisedimenticolia bacterium]|nr:hypothetical protein [Candidatus Polarisedimenticolia bacterium]
MDVADAQREVRQVFRGGFMGQLVSGMIWLASAAAATWGTPRLAMLILVCGGFFIFALTMLGLRLLGGPWKLSPGNPLNALGMQVAFVLPLCLPLVGAATLQKLEWFYPALMVLMGAHYLPFIFLYGMPMFGVLAAVLVGLGLLMANAARPAFAVPAWVTGAVLILFAFTGLWLAGRERRRIAGAVGQAHTCGVGGGPSVG